MKIVRDRDWFLKIMYILLRCSGAADTVQEVTSIEQVQMGTENT